MGRCHLDQALTTSQAENACYQQSPLHKPQPEKGATYNKVSVAEESLLITTRSMSTQTPRKRRREVEDETFPGKYPSAKSLPVRNVAKANVESRIAAASLHDEIGRSPKRARQATYMQSLPPQYSGDGLRLLRKEVKHLQSHLDMLISVVDVFKVAVIRMVDSLADIRMQLGVVAQDLDPQQSYTT